MAFSRKDVVKDWFCGDRNIDACLDQLQRPLLHQPRVVEGWVGLRPSPQGGTQPLTPSSRLPVLMQIRSPSSPALECHSEPKCWWYLGQQTQSQMSGTGQHRPNPAIHSELACASPKEHLNPQEKPTTSLFYCLTEKGQHINEGI